jgi:hypothetical protein
MPRLDRILEMHPVWLQARSQKPEYEKVRQHWEWLKSNTTTPVYMLSKHPQVPMSVRYPLEEVQAMLPESRRKSVLTSSFDYLMGLAVIEGYDRIEAYGFEMGSDTEYRYQREGASYWIGYCDAHGIEVVLPTNTALLSKRLYGYEGGSMIYRQDLERMKEVRTIQKRNAFAELANLEGRMKQVVLDGLQDTQTHRDLQFKWDEQYRIALVTSGALQECEYYLKEIDLEEPSEDLTDPTEFIKIEA